MAIDFFDLLKVSKIISNFFDLFKVSKQPSGSSHSLITENISNLTLLQVKLQLFRVRF